MDKSGKKGQSITQRAIACRSNTRSKRARNNKGSGIVEGVVGLWLVIVGLVVTAVFLADVGLMTYYKQKLRHCTTELVNLASLEIASPFFPDAEAVHTDMLNKVKAFVQSNGLGSSAKLTDWNVTYDGTALKNPTSVSFTVSVSGLQMLRDGLPFGVSFPVAFALSDSASALIDGTRPRFCTAMLSECSQSHGGVGVNVWVPTYAGGTYDNGSFSNQLGKYPKARFSQVNFFGVGTVANIDRSNLWNTNWTAPGSLTYRGPQVAFTKLFQIEGTYPY